MGNGPSSIQKVFQKPGEKTNGTQFIFAIPAVYTSTDNPLKLEGFIYNYPKMTMNGQNFNNIKNVNFITPEGTSVRINQKDYKIVDLGSGTYSLALNIPAKVINDKKNLEYVVSFSYVENGTTKNVVQPSTKFVLEKEVVNKK